MPRSNAIGPKTVRELQRMEERIRALKLEWKTMSDRLVSTCDTRDQEFQILRVFSAKVGVLRGVEDALRAARAIVSNRRLVMIEDDEGEKV